MSMHAVTNYIWTDTDKELKIKLEFKQRLSVAIGAAKGEINIQRLNLNIEYSD